MRTPILLMALSAATSACTEYGYVEHLFYEEFQQVDLYNEADILFVVDDSASMAEEQAVLTENFAVFTEVLVDTEASFHLGVVTTDVSGDQAGLLRGGVITPGTADLAAALLEALEVGTGGSREEQGLAAASLALDGRNPDFLRPAGKLSVVVYSDEDDHSPGPVLGYLDSIAGVAGAGGWSIHGVVGDLPDGCISGDGAADSGERYIDAVLFTDGYVDSICNTDHSDILTRVGLEATGLLDTFPLAGLPNPSTIVVWVDDVRIPERPIDGWTYHPGENAIVFHGRAVPRPGMRIGVEYTLLLGS